MAEIQIELAPAEIFSIGDISITNAMFGLWLSMAIIFLGVFLVRRKAGVVPSRGQVLVEGVMDFMMEKMVIAFGKEETARKFFPLICTIFIMLLVANQMSLVPLVESITAGDAGSLFRTPASHFSLTIGLTLFLLILANGLAFVKSPLRHIGNFIKLDAIFGIRKLSDVPMALLDFFLGLLDIIGELAKLISLSARLFGNVLAGQVIYIVLISLVSVADYFVFTQFLIPIPFLVLGIISGLVQAFVFAMLGTVYMSQSLAGVEEKN